ncbi:MAG: DegV family protein [Chloroflexota bacterium]
MIKIVTDSTCNLTEETLKQYDIRVAPIAIQFGDNTYEEEININRDLFYQKIEEMGILPTTSQPTPAWFARFYRELSEQGHSILVITITSKHSGTYDSAVLGKSMVPGADVEIFDSLSISLGTGWMVLEAARMIEKGHNRESVLRRLKEIRDRIYLYLTPATLKYLQMSGRVGRLQFAIGSLVNLKPVIAVENGVLEAIENVRTRGKAVKRLVDLMEEKVGTTDAVNVGVIHARVPEEGQDLLEQVQSRLDCKETLVADLVSSLAVHGGPGVLGLVAYRA